MTEAQNKLVEQIKKEQAAALKANWSMTKLLVRNPKAIKDAGHKSLEDALKYMMDVEARESEKNDERLRAAGL